MDPSDYVVDVSESKDRSLCLLLLAESETPFLVMGLPLFVNYYTVHEDVSGRIGFAPHSTSTKNGPYEGRIPLEEFDNAHKILDKIKDGQAVIGDNDEIWSPDFPDENTIR